LTRKTEETLFSRITTSSRGKSNRAFRLRALNGLLRTILALQIHFLLTKHQYSWKHASIQASSF